MSNDDLLYDLFADEPWVGWDLDGSLAFYDRDGDFEYTYIGAPTPLVKLLKEYISRGIRCKIFTARVAVGPAFRIRVEEAIQAWCLKHVGKSLEVTNVKDFRMIKLYDDRAIQVEHNTGRILGDDTAIPGKKKRTAYDDIKEVMTNLPATHQL